MAKDGLYFVSLGFQIKNNWSQVFDFLPIVAILKLPVTFSNLEVNKISVRLYLSYDLNIFEHKFCFKKDIPITREIKSKCGMALFHKHWCQTFNCWGFLGKYCQCTDRSIWSEKRMRIQKTRWLQVGKHTTMY